MLSLVGVGTSVTSASTGGMATLNSLTSRASLTFPAESVTLTVQSEYVPSGRVLKVTVVILSASVVVLLSLLLLQLPPYVMAPASFE